MLGFKSLLSDDGKNASAGLIILWMTFFMCIYFWFHPQKPCPSSLIEAFQASLVYGILKKGVNAYTITRTSGFGGLMGGGIPGAQPLPYQQQPIHQPIINNKINAGKQDDITDEDLSETKPMRK